MRRAAAAAVLVVVFVAGCGFPTEDDPSPLDAGDQPAYPTVASSDVVTGESIDVWFVRDGRLVPLSRRLDPPLTAEAVVGVLGQGTTESEASDGYRSALPDPAMIEGATLAGGTATIRLSSTFAEVPAGDQVLALGQLVYSVTELRGVGVARFEIDGVLVAVPLPDGTSSEGSVSRDDFGDLVAGE